MNSTGQTTCNYSARLEKDLETQRKSRDTRTANLSRHIKDLQAELDHEKRKVCFLRGIVEKAVMRDRGISREEAASVVSLAILNLEVKAK